MKSGRDTELAPPPITPATSIVTPYAKKPRLSKSPAVFTLGSDDEKIESIALNGEPQVLDDSLNEGEEPEAELDELNIQGALTEELKILQDRNRSLQQQLEDMERRVVHLTQAKGTLEAQLRELTQVREWRRGEGEGRGGGRGREGEKEGRGGREEGREGRRKGEGEGGRERGREEGREGGREGEREREGGRKGGGREEGEREEE